jgi:hypothetical protein
VLRHITPEESQPYLERMAERRQVDRALLTFMGAELPWMTAKKATVTQPKEQAIGEACGREHIPLSLCATSCSATASGWRAALVQTKQEAAWRATLNWRSSFAWSPINSNPS